MKNSIKLNNKEKYIFDRLKNISAQTGTTIRVTGGWVRDKLLGLQPDDIDIMIDNMSGEQFANIVAKKEGYKDPHVIKTNPEKSKNISTAVLNMPLPSGEIMKIDIAQARQEVYSDNSRNPSVVPATAQEDAMRRDLTINSLFYNINTNQIEDFTGKGLSDLKSNTIRTPLEPLKTFEDDPLRIFRTIRFAAKYNGKIDDKTMEALSDPKLINAIKNKISKERIGIEFEKMMKNPNPVKSIELLKKTGLMQMIWEESIHGSEYHGKTSPLDMDQNNSHHELSLWEHTMQVVRNVDELYKDAEPEKRATMLLAALFHDLGKTVQWIQKPKGNETSYPGHEDESSKIAEHLLKYMKMEPYIKEVSKLCQHHMHGHALERDSSSGKSLRRYIRKMTEDAIEWLDAFTLSMADAYSKNKEVKPETVQTYNNLKKKLQEALSSMDLSPSKQVNTVLNGNDIMNILDMKPGPQIKTVLEFVQDIQDENPNITKEDASKKVTERFKKTASTASLFLVDAEIENINECLRKKQYRQAMTFAKAFGLRNPNDSNCYQVLAQTYFICLQKNSSLKDMAVTNFLWKKVNREFYDGILCAYLAGILATSQTNIEEKDIIELAEKAKVLSSGSLEKVQKHLKVSFDDNLKNRILSI